MIGERSRFRLNQGVARDQGVVRDKSLFKPGAIRADGRQPHTREFLYSNSLLALASLACLPHSIMNCAQKKNKQKKNMYK